MNEASAVKDLSGTAQVVLTRAVEYCAQKMRLDTSQAVIDRLRAGNGRACEYCHYSVAKQVAESMGSLDENVKAAYIYDYDATPEDLCFGMTGRALPIHLLVWAGRKTAALNVLAETWDRALAEEYAEVIGGRKPARVLDLQVVDDADVEERLGHGALLFSLHHRPVQVWRR
ncbi:MAG TPA: hypothetical protein VLY63_31680 [Anaerolineae bacterium]|nr:hypothetical protein [Anaerolineae bacterium]